MRGTHQLVNGIDPRLMALLVSAFQAGKAGQLVFYHETYVRAWELTKELNPAHLQATAAVPLDVRERVRAAMVESLDLTVANVQNSSGGIDAHELDDFRQTAVDTAMLILAEHAAPAGDQTPELPTPQAGVMFRVGGRPFSCECNCNVFTKKGEGLYVCNACKAEYSDDNYDSALAGEKL